MFITWSLCRGQKGDPGLIFIGVLQAGSWIFQAGSNPGNPGGKSNPGHWSSVVYIHWRQVTLSLSVKVDVDVSVVSDCVCRWVKWTSPVQCCLRSLTSSVLVTVSQSRCRCECRQWLRVCRWVKWTSLVECCLHSLTSSVLVTVSQSRCRCECCQWLCM